MPLKRFMIVYGLIAALVAAALWWFSIVPWWAIPLIAVFGPIVLLIILGAVLFGAWGSGGYH